MILHGRNRKEPRLPELPDLSVEVFDKKTKTVYEFKWYYWQGHSVCPFRDAAPYEGHMLAERYEQTMFRLECKSRAFITSQCGGVASWWRTTATL